MDAVLTVETLLEHLQSGKLVVRYLSCDKPSPSMSFFVRVDIVAMAGKDKSILWLTYIEHPYHNGCPTLQKYIKYFTKPNECAEIIKQWSEEVPHWLKMIDAQAASFFDDDSSIFISTPMTWPKVLQHLGAIRAILMLSPNEYNIGERGMALNDFFRKLDALLTEHQRQWLRCLK